MSYIPLSFNAIASILGQNADPNSGWVFKSDGAGSGTMQKNTQSIANYLTVGSAGDVDYNSISDAITAAVTGGAMLGNLWEIRVYPGFYFEAPFTVPSGIIVTAQFTEVEPASFLVAQDPNSDFVTLTGGTIGGFIVMGVANPLKALFRAASGTSQITTCYLTACSNGIIVDPGAVLVGGILITTPLAPGFEIGTALTIDGGGSPDGAIATIDNFILDAPDPSGYVVNPIQTGINATNGGSLLINSQLTASVGDVDGTSIMLNVNTSATAVVRNATITHSNIALQIGASAAVPQCIITLLEGYLTDNVTNFNILSSTGLIFANCITDTQKSSAVPGGNLSGILQQLNTPNQTNLVGNNAVSFETLRTASIPLHIRDASDSGLQDGGDVSDAGGLSVLVGAGDGWIVRDSPPDATNVSWNPATVALAANATNFVFIDDSSELPAASTSVPGPEKILLRIVVTNGIGIRFIHLAPSLTRRASSLIQNYLLDTQKVVLKSGLAMTAGSSVTKFSIGVGQYFRGLAIASYAGTVDTVFSYFYGANGVSEVPVQTAVDITHYDNAGVLTAMTASWYRLDSVYLTSDGRVSVIYGTAQFATEPDAESQPIAPPMSFISESAFSIAKIVVQQGVGINTIIDQRVVTAKAGAAAIISHSSLSDLLADDHPQYILGNGTRAMSGDLNLGTNDIINVGLLDSVDITDHHVRHQPGGIDAVPTAVPANLIAAAAASEGIAPSVARSDHQHGVPTGTPSTVGTANAEGASSSFVRLDHVHAHGAQTDDSLHATAVASVSAGFISAADQAKLDGLTPGAAVSSVSGTAPIVSSGGTTPAISITNATDGADGAMSAADKTKLDGIAPGAAALTSIAPVNVDKSAAVVGVAITAARADHKHDITTTAPVTVGTANTEGVAASLSRSDHVHSHGNQTVGTMHAAVIAAGASGFMTGTDKTKLDGLPASAVPTSRILTAGNGLTGGGDLSADRTFNVGANVDGSITVNPTDIQVGILATDAQHGNRGGGALHANVVASGAAGFMTGTDKAKLDGITPGAGVASVGGTAPIVSSGGTTPAISITAATTLAAGSMSAADKTKLNGLPTSAVPTTRTLTAGNGLTGGGDLSADRTFTVGANVDGSITVNAADIQVGILATDAQHGNRGGGAIHATAVASGAAGFLSGADKAKLDSLSPGGVTSVSGTAPIASSGGTTPAISITAATTLAAGSMSAADKTKLNGITSGAAVASVSGTAPVVSSGGTTPAISVTTGVPVATGNANSAGSAASLALSDHVHQTKIEAQSATATGAITTSSATDVAMTGMSVTPGAGNWMAWFTTDVSNGNLNQSVTVSIYANGVQIAASQVVVTVIAASARHPLACLATISALGAGQAVTVQWHTSGNTATANNRTLVLTRTQ